MAQRKTASNKTIWEVAHNQYVSPEIVDVTGDKWVLWGDNNSYWEFLNELFFNSPSNSACINGILRLAYGRGLFRMDGSEPYKIYSMLSRKDLKRMFLQFVKTSKITLQVDYKITDNIREIKGVFYRHGKTIAPGKRNALGDITHYYYCESGKWNDNRTKKVRIPAFGYGDENCRSEIFFYQKAYDSDCYYGPVDYQGGVQYAELEIETANYHLNLSHNGFTPSAIINLNNGQLNSEQERRQIVNDIVSKRTGSSNAGKIVVLFNESSANAATIEPYHIPDPHKQYEFVSKESMEKIFLAHNITSPLLLGIRDTGGGLGSNKEEIQEAYNLFNLMVLDPMRENIIDALREIFGGLAMDLEFNQFEYFTEETQPEPQAATMNQFKIHGPCAKDMTAEDEELWLSRLEGLGEVIDPDEYEMIYETEVSDPDMEMQAKFERFDKMPTESDAKPEDASRGNSGLFKVRYAYGPQELSVGKSGKVTSRKFCRKMVEFAKNNTVYRIEDIAQMSMGGVNGQFAPKGQSIYDIWRWKGGVYCHHRWYRRVYFRKRNAAGQFLEPSKTPQLENDKRVSIAEAERRGVPSEVLRPNGYTLAETRPIDTPNRGSLKNR